MIKSAKLSTLAILLLLASTLWFGGANAQAATPSVPTFTLSIFDYTHRVEPKSTTNPYTGETVQQGGGYALENITVLVTIPNQPFSSSTLPDGNVTELFYAVRFKGHFDQWGGSSERMGYWLQRSTSGNTVITFFKGWGGAYYGANQILPDDSDAQVDFQVKAIAGYNYTNRLPPPDYVILGYVVESLAESQWSDIQTLTLPSGATQNGDVSTTPSPQTATQEPPSTPTENPTQPQMPDTAKETTNGSDAAMQTLILAAALLFGVLLIILIVGFSHKRRQPNAN